MNFSDEYNLSATQCQISRQPLNNGRGFSMASLRELLQEIQAFWKQTEAQCKKAFGRTFQWITLTRKEHKHITPIGNDAADDSDFNLLL